LIVTDEAGSAEALNPLDVERAARAVGRIVSAPSPELVEDVLTKLEWKHLAAGETLFEYGDASDAAYFVLRGRLRVTAPTEDGGERFIRDLGKGEIIGEIGLINSAPRSATLRAVRDSALGRLSAPAFLEIVGRFPEAAISIANTLLGRAASRPDATEVGSVTLFVPEGDANLGSRIGEAMRAYGTVEHVSRDRLETLLGEPGIAEIPPGHIESKKVARTLADLEDRAGRLLLEADPTVTGWTERTLRSCDLVIVVTDPEPSDRVDAEIRRLMDMLGTMPHIDAWLVIQHPAGVERPHGTAALRSRYRADAVVHLRADRPDDLDRLARLASGEGVGLVLGGGGARGLAHFGVHRAAMEAGIPIDHIGGSSIGGIIGAVIAQGHDPDVLLDLAQRQFRKVVDYTLPVVSLAKGRRASRELEARFGGWTFEDLWTPFFCMSTNLTNTDSVVHDSGDLVRALRAGFSIPGVFPPTPVGDDLHVDAGVLDNLPVDTMRARPGIGSVIAVDVAPPVGPRARADYGLSVSGWRAFRKGLGGRRSVYPGISAVLMRSMILGSMRERDRVVATGAADLYVDLDLRGISLLDFKRVREIADAGHEAAMPRLQEWWSQRE
jgi:predicted acylesterase/phospholipase RssA/CRP-like cAMP-binding protein